MSKGGNDRIRLRTGLLRGGKWIGAVGLLLAGGALHASIVINGFTSATNDRFANDPSFIGAGYDWSGVGRTTSSRWGTLVSPNVFVSANHYHPAVNSSFQFYPGNDPGATPITRTVSSGQRIGTSDVWVGVLNAPVPGEITFYDFPSELIGNASDFLNSSIAGKNSWMWGLSPSSFPAPTDMAVGRNILDQWYDHDIVTDDTLGDDAAMAVKNLETDPNFVPYEAYLMSGDSGGPMFTLDSGSLVLTGINWFNGSTTIPNLGDRNISGFSYLGNYSDDIQAYIDANPVPETGSVLVGFLLVGVAVFWRGRRAAEMS